MKPLMYQEEFQKKEQQVISIYKIVYQIVFRYGIFFLIIIWGIYATYSILQQNINIITITDNDASQKALTVKTFKKHINAIQGTWDMKVFVGMGTFTQSGSFLASYNNLITYRGFTLPRYFSWDLSTFDDIDILEGSWYTRKRLEQFMNTIRSINNNDTLVIQPNISLPIKDTVITTFNLQCLSQAKIYNGMCDAFTHNFVDTFMLYDITTDFEWFKSIFTNLLWDSEYQDTICKNLIYYSYYTRNTSDDIKAIMKMCTPNDYDTFNKFALFSTIQKQLENKNIDNTVYSDDIINAYKINSFLQILYQDIHANRINADRINSYFDFVEELLKEDKLNSLRTNIIYDFNNYTLKNILENPQLSIQLWDQTEISILLKRINSINNGNLLIWYKWLKYKVNDEIGMVQVASLTWTKEENYGQSIDNLLSQITALSIDTKQISGNQILIKWAISVNGTNWKVTNLSVKIRFEEQSNILFVKKIDIANASDLSTTINNFTSKQYRSFWDLQKYLNNNVTLFTVDPTTWTWSGIDTFCQKTKELFWWAYSIDKCDTKTLVASRTRNGNKVRVEIIYQNYIFKSIGISDTAAKEKIQAFLQTPETVTKYSIIDITNMGQFMKDVLDSLNQEANANTWSVDINASQNTILVIETVKKYLWVKVSDIAEKWNRIAISFTISWVNLIGMYSLPTRTIEEVYFKDILLNNSPVLVKNTKIILDDNHLSDIKLFLKDPITYFKNKSPENYLIYMKNK